MLQKCLVSTEHDSTISENIYQSPLVITAATSVDQNMVAKESVLWSFLQRSSENPSGQSLALILVLTVTLQGLALQ